MTTPEAERSRKNVPDIGQGRREKKGNRTRVFYIRKREEKQHNMTNERRVWIETAATLAHEGYGIEDILKRAGSEGERERRHGSVSRKCTE